MKKHPKSQTKKEAPLIFPSMLAASGALNLPLAVLKLAKNSGCDAFAGSRVTSANLLAWLKKHPEILTEGRSRQSDAERKLANSLELQEIVIRVMSGELLLRSEITPKVQTGMARLMAVLRHQPIKTYNAICRDCQCALRGLANPSRSSEMVEPPASPEPSNPQGRMLANEIVLQRLQIDSRLNSYIARADLETWTTKSMETIISVVQKHLPSTQLSAFEKEASRVTTWILKSC